MASPIVQIGRVSNTSVQKATKRGWREWIDILDATPARAWAHKEIAAFLKKKFKLRIWWQHEVATGYEIHIGRKIAGRNAKGKMSVTATRSIHEDARKVWKALISKRGIALWLKPLSPVTIKVGNFFETEDGYFGEVRTMLAGRRIRLSWKEPDGSESTYVQILLVPRPNKKCILVVNHEGIVGVKFQAAVRRRWREALEIFSDFL